MKQYIKEEKRAYYLEILKSVSSLTEFGNKLGVTRERARQLVNAYSLPYDKEKKVKERYVINFTERDKDLISDFLSGMKITDIISKYNTSCGMIKRILNENSIDRSFGRKLKIRKRDEDIFRLFKQGFRRKDIAEQFNLKEARIYKICGDMLRNEGIFLIRGQHYKGLVNDQKRF